MPSTNYAPLVFKALNGLGTFYKPLGVSGKVFTDEIRERIADQLNRLQVRPLDTRLVIVGNYGEQQKLTTVKNYGDHPAVVGPRYVPWEIPMYSLHTAKLSSKTSGVCPILIGEEAIMLYGQVMISSVMTQIYEIKATFGYKTNTHFDDGAIIDKTNHTLVRKHQLDRILDKIASNQKDRIFDATSTPINSQEAFLLAQSWPSSIPKKLVKFPVIYDLRCVEFNSPDFTVQVTVNKGNENLFAHLINDVGMLLRNTATAKSIRRVKCGPFISDNSLCDQEWDLKSIINNIEFNKQYMNRFGIGTNPDVSTKASVSN